MKFKYGDLIKSKEGFGEIIDDGLVLFYKDGFTNVDRLPADAQVIDIPQVDIGQDDPSNEEYEFKYSDIPVEEPVIKYLLNFFAENSKSPEELDFLITILHAVYVELV